MFTGPELSMFHDPYFSIIRLNDIWRWLMDQQVNDIRISQWAAIVLEAKYYHQQRRQVCSVRNAIRIIKEHDRYVLSCR